MGESVKKYGMPGSLGSELRAQPGAFPLRRAICGVSELVREASEWLLGIFGLVDESWVLSNLWLVLHMVVLSWRVLNLFINVDGKLMEMEFI